MRIKNRILIEIVIIAPLCGALHADLYAVGHLSAREVSHSAEEIITPVVVTTVTPEYPGLALRAAAEGQVGIKVQIDGEGEVVSAEVVKSHGLFDEAALAASRQWLFNRDSSRGRREVILTLSFRRIGVEEGSDPDDHPTSIFSPPFHLAVNHVMPWLLKLKDPGPWGAGNRTCEVHGETLRLDIVPIGYGLPVINKKYEKAKKKRFPHESESYGGGCILQYPRRAEVLFCPRCREAKSAWLAKRRR